MLDTSVEEGFRKGGYSALCHGAGNLKYVDKGDRRRFTGSPASHIFVLHR